MGVSMEILNWLFHYESSMNNCSIFLPQNDKKRYPYRDLFSLPISTV